MKFFLSKFPSSPHPHPPHHPNKKIQAVKPQSSVSQHMRLDHYLKVFNICNSGIFYSGSHSPLCIVIPSLRVAVPSLRVAVPSLRVAVPSLRVAVPSLRVAVPSRRVVIHHYGYTCIRVISTPVQNVSLQNVSSTKRLLTK
jgi:hypothetical protein